MKTTSMLITTLLLLASAQFSIAGPAWKKLQIRYEITGVFDHKDLQSGHLYYNFHGGLFVSPNANQQTGEVSAALGRMIGVITDWQLKFDLRNNIFSNLDTRISCVNACEIKLDDGGVLRLLRDNPRTYRKENHIPMQVRFMPELGEVPMLASVDTALATDPALDFPHHIRALGCMGFEETAGKGYLADTVGAMCINGTFKFPTSIRSAPIETMDIIKAQSNATIVMHKR